MSSTLLRLNLRHSFFFVLFPSRLPHFVRVAWPVRLIEKFQPYAWLIIWASTESLCSRRFVWDCVCVHIYTHTTLFRFSCAALERNTKGLDDSECPTWFDESTLWLVQLCQWLFFPPLQRVQRKEYRTPFRPLARLTFWLLLPLPVYQLNRDH